MFLHGGSFYKFPQVQGQYFKVVLSAALTASSFVPQGWAPVII